MNWMLLQPTYDGNWTQSVLLAVLTSSLDRNEFNNTMTWQHGDWDYIHAVIFSSWGGTYMTSSKHHPQRQPTITKWVTLSVAMFPRVSESSWEGDGGGVVDSHQYSDNSSSSSSCVTVSRSLSTAMKLGKHNQFNYQYYLLIVFTIRSYEGTLVPSYEGVKKKKKKKKKKKF